MIPSVVMRHDHDSGTGDNAPSFQQLLATQLSRRCLLQQGLRQGLTASGLLGGGLLSGGMLWELRPATAADKVPALAATFAEAPASSNDQITLPPGYVHDLLIRWGDPLHGTGSALDTRTIASGALTSATAASAQLQQFGTNCDAIHYFRLDAGVLGSASIRSRSGVLCVNNEYTNDELLFPERKLVWGTDPEYIRAFVSKFPGSVAFAKAAHGISVVEIARDVAGPWRYNRDSRLNRRISADTPMEMRGPARGAELLRTHADPTGTRVRGTLANCAGGRTPWGSYLSAEENLQDYFGNFKALREARGADAPTLRAHRRMRHWDSVSPHGWELVDARFDALAEPREALRFGWIVELDPLDARKPPLKRTALGRFAHEAATTTVATRGQLVVYLGDDDLFEYVYKYVSNGRVSADAATNDRLLDEGTLYVARFAADGSGEWLPLRYHSDGPLNAAAGFRNQAEVLIQTRAAADLLSATPMDRPEDIEVHPTTGRIYIACTRNEARTPLSASINYAGRSVDRGVNAPNPRATNSYGHIVEITEAGDDHTATRFRWDVMLMGPNSDGSRTTLGSPDNLAFDDAGRLWIVTDGAQPDGGNDGCFVCETEGPNRGVLRRLMSGPKGAEIAGCVFSPGCDTLFLSIQHPGEGGTLSHPISSWPDGDGRQPRSSVIAIRRADGGVVGT
jgi:uncharacterized protein